MRNLTVEELDFVAGATGVCTSSSHGNNYGGVTDTGSIGGDLINVYEGLVAVTSHIIERIANAF